MSMNSHSQTYRLKLLLGHTKDIKNKCPPPPNLMLSGFMVIQNVCHLAIVLLSTLVFFYTRSKSQSVCFCNTNA